MTSSNSRLWNDRERLKALERYQILDTPVEDEFDNIVTLIAQICDMPVSMITFVDENRQWFKAEKGIGVRETPIDHSACKIAIQQQGLFVVPDTKLDSRFENNPLVQNDPHFRFYASSVLETEDGFPLGTLCVLDYKPRTLTPEQSFALQTLSRLVMTQLELRRALQEKRASEQQFRDMTNSINQMVWVADPNGHHEYYNKRWYEYTGIEEDTKTGWEDVFHPDDFDRASRIWQNSLETGEPYEVEYRLRRNDGEYRWMLGRAECVRNKSGAIKKWYGTCTDIEELVEVRDKLREASVAKTEFLANMSHEIRTPINAIMGLANILAHSEPLTPKQFEFIKTLQMSADTLLALINDLLDISKIEARSVELETIPFSLSKIVQEIISMMNVHAQEKGLDFNVIAGPEIDQITHIGDPNRIRQVLVNLCSNALKFTERGGIEIKLHSTPLDETNIHNVFIAIKDTGIGIAPDKQDAVFHKFSQADASINRKYGGTGLGLAITKTLTEIMGGTIKLDSVEGKGSTFTVTIPLEAEPNPVSAELQNNIAPPTPSIGDRKRILLVEDYPANVLVTSTFLEKFGYDCDVAGNGIEAIEKVQQNSYALTLMDVQMQGMNGLEATILIREHEKQKNLSRLPIIGMTAHAMAGDKERCLAAGMDDYLPKPFNSDDLHNKIKTLISEGV